MSNSRPAGWMWPVMRSEPAHAVILETVKRRFASLRPGPHQVINILTTASSAPAALFSPMCVAQPLAPLWRRARRKQADGYARSWTGFLELLLRGQSIVITLMAWLRGPQVSQCVGQHCTLCLASSSIPPPSASLILLLRYSY